MSINQIFITQHHGICACCGGMITSRRHEFIFEWYCEKADGFPCSNYGKNLPMASCEKCLLENESIINKRKNYRAFIVKNLLEILEAHDFCAIPKSATEVLRAIKDNIDIFKDISIWEKEEYLILKRKL